MTIYLLPQFISYYNRVTPEGEGYYAVHEDITPPPWLKGTGDVLEQKCFCWLCFEICYTTMLHKEIAE